jgi:hypothetical protein
MAEIIDMDDIRIIRDLDEILKEHPEMIVSPDEEEMKRIEQMLIGVEIDE